MSPMIASAVGGSDKNTDMDEASVVESDETVSDEKEQVVPDQMKIEGMKVERDADTGEVVIPDYNKTPLKTQEFLISQGYEISADGQFGPGSKAALESYKNFPENKNVKVKEGISLEGIDPGVQGIISGAASSLPFDITITSAVRTKDGNTDAGGAEGSDHEGGTAGDIRTPRDANGKIEWKKMEKIVDALIEQGGPLGLGIYGDGGEHNSHLHFDSRKGGAKGEKGIWFEGDAPEWIKEKYNKWRQEKPKKNEEHSKGDGHGH